MVHTYKDISCAVPEVMVCSSTKGYEGTAADVWSIAVCLVELLCGLGTVESASPWCFEALFAVFSDFLVVFATSRALVGHVSRRFQGRLRL